MKCRERTIWAGLNRSTCLAVVSVVGVAALAIALASCGTGALSPFVVAGAGGTENDPPTLTILEPIADITRGQGERFLISWTDTDRDSNASISFELVNVATNESILLVQGLDENDTTGPDSFSASTALVPQARYNIRGTIDDGVNNPVVVYAQTEEAGADRVVVTVSAPGAVPPTVPPVVTVVEPAYNQSVAQDDVLSVVVQPTQAVPDASRPYDPDSGATLYIVLDLDQDPNNDDPANPLTDASGELTREDLIVLRTASVEQDAFDQIAFLVQIDLDDIPPRTDGKPYYIRATIDDLTNPRVHQYAAGSISVVDLAAGTVDLYDVGRVKSGARWYGFSPNARLGTVMSTVSDFDADGIADFMMVAKTGNPRNLGPVGEAYLVYGVEQVRFGGALSVNSVSDVISGVIFEGTPIRTSQIPDSNARSEGVTDIGWINDVTGDGRPEILIGMGHVHGALSSMDFDPADENVGAIDTAEEVEVTIRQGRVEVNGSATNLTYAGVEDTAISSEDPNQTNGSGDLSWRNAAPDEREWTLIKFVDVLQQIPDTLANIDVTSISASLELRVYDTGANGELYQALTDFDESTTYSTFAENGGDPEVDIDYYQEPGTTGGLGDVGGEEAVTVAVDVSDLVRQLIDRQLGEYDDELRFIIIPNEDEEEGRNRTGVRSSEYSVRPSDRPLLRITYEKSESIGASGCYPDRLVNNATATNDFPLNDVYWYAGGMALVLNSQNRDNLSAVGINTNRLEATSVALELIGQQSTNLDANGITELGFITARADNASASVAGNDPQESGRVAGTRFIAGPYDYVDASFLNQPPREGLFGNAVSSMGDLNNDQLDELIFSAPRNEQYLDELDDRYGLLSTHLESTVFRGSIWVLPGQNYNQVAWRDKATTDAATSTTPHIDHFRVPPFGSCSGVTPREIWGVPGGFSVYAEDPSDFLGDGQSAGDFNQDGLDDILCGAPLNDRGNRENSGASYILYGRTVLGDFDLGNADQPQSRPPMLRIRGNRTGDQVGWRQATGLDVNGDRIDDVFIASPWVDFGDVTRTSCARDYNGDGVVADADLSLANFTACQTLSESDDIFSDDPCKAFDYDNDGDVDSEDQCVFCCLSGDCDPADDCVNGQDGGNCCGNMVDNGFVGVIFGGVFLDGDRTLTQLATSDLPGVVFYGSEAGHLAGYDVSSAGDFNQDGFGDILISVPGQTWVDSNLRERLGVVYLIFGGTHLYNSTWDLSEVGSSDLPGIVFYSPYVKGRPNEAAPLHVGFIGDINDDGFGDIAIGNPNADFIDLTYPQGPDAPGSDPSAGRRPNAGDVYVIYGNNFGSNRSLP